MRMLELGDLTSEELAKTLGMSTETSTALLDRMKSRGLIIETAKNARFAPLHPRMSMTNLFKVFEKDLVQSLRDRRTTVDRVVNLLTPIFEDRRK